MKNKPIYYSLATGVILGAALTVGAFFLSKTVIVAAPSFKDKKAASEELAAPIRGDSKAPIKITEYADFYCPYCKKSFETMKKILETYPDTLQLEFKHFPLTSKPGEGSFLVHEASVCAQKQGKFWEFYDAVFTHDRLSNRDAVIKLAETLNIDIQKFQACLDGHGEDLYLLRSKEEGRSKGVSGTPSFFINQYFVRGAQPAEFFDQLIRYIQDPEKNLPPPGINDAERQSPNYRYKNLEQGPKIGPDNAPISMVEFSDYFCPFCKKAAPILNQLMEKYPGKIKRYFRHFPLDFHVGAKDAHQAAECAGEQGKFWEYHQAMMASPTPVRDKEAYVKLAADLGLTRQDFENCFGSQKYYPKIDEDIAAGVAANVEGTPTVFINGLLISGAQPLEAFEQIIDRELKQEKK